MKNNNSPLTTCGETAVKNYPVIPEEDSTKTGTCWSWKKLRKLPRFASVDPSPSQRLLQWTEMLEAAELELFCLKQEARNYNTRKHTAGLFVGTCLHQICYGFHCMLDPEGRKDLLKVLFERMPQEVLDVLHVVYDFNCQEAEYMLNRVPSMFAKTRLFIDRFHAMSHKCASVFKLQAYPAFQELVTTGSEQFNFFLQKYHSNTPFMTQSTYITFVRLLAGLHNYKVNRNIAYVAQKYCINL